MAIDKEALMSFKTELEQDIAAEKVKKDRLVEILAKVANRCKLSVEEQIIYMKYKGITFNHISEVDATRILNNNTYYYKVTSFRKNIEKVDGKYVNLDFGLLNDLATIDMYLRYISIKLSLDIEHTLKSMLVNTITGDSTEDGVSIVKEYDDYCKEILFKEKPTFPASKYKSVDKKIMSRNKESSSYHFDMYSKRRVNPPIWVLIELMSFGELIRFIEFYYEKNKYNKKLFEKAYNLLKYTKNFRDSAAHSRPLLLNITDFEKLTPSEDVTIYAGQSGIEKKDRKKYFTNIKLHDFTCILFLHDFYIKSKEMKDDRKDELKKLEVRCLKRKKNYKEQNDLKKVYEMFVKIIAKYNSQ